MMSEGSGGRRGCAPMRKRCAVALKIASRVAAASNAASTPFPMTSPSAMSIDPSKHEKCA